MTDVEVHIKRKHDSKQTLCAESQGAAMPPLDTHYAVSFVELLLFPRGMVPQRQLGQTNCLMCLLELQRHLLDVASNISVRIGQLHDNTLKALDEHIEKLKENDVYAAATIAVLDRTSALVKETKQSMERTIELLKHNHFIGEVVALTRDCELGKFDERAVVVKLDGNHMTLVFADRVPKQREVTTGVDYLYLRGVEGGIQR